MSDKKKIYTNTHARTVLYVVYVVVVVVMFYVDRFSEAISWVINVFGYGFLIEYQNHAHRQ